MFKWIKKFTSRILVLILLIELLPSVGSKNKLFIKTEKASAFSTQLDSLAPGYVIRQEKDGITFDLTNRLSDTMNVESFKFRNADPNKRKDDKEETMLDGDNTIWVSKDTLEHGNTYEIEADIYDSETEKTVKHINHFKFNDRNKIFRPKLQIVDLTNVDSFNAGKYVAKDLRLDLNQCTDLVNKSQKIDIEILNSDLTKTSIDKVSLTSEEIRKNGYTIIFNSSEGVIQVNKDYVVRASFDGKVWDSLLSGVLKANPKIHQILNTTNFYTASRSLLDFPNIPSFGNVPSMTKDKGTLVLDKNTGNLQISIDPLKLGYRQERFEKIKIILSSDNPGLRPVEVVGYPSNTKYNLQIPNEYFGKEEPANLRFIYTGDGDKILSDVTLQLGLLSKDKLKIWSGMEFSSAQQLPDGYKINKVRLYNEVENAMHYKNIPHSWDKFPKAHYITLFDGLKSKQIGGEFRFDVMESKTEFVGSDDNGKEHDVANANFKIPYGEMKQGFNTFYFKVESSNHYRDWLYAYVPFFIYADIVKVESLELDMKDIVPSNDKYSFSMVPLNFKPQIGEKMSIIDDEGKEHFSSATNGKEFSFNNVPLVQGGKYIVIYNKISSLFHFNSLDSSILFNPTIIGTDVEGQQGIEILMDKKIVELMNSDNSKNKFRILYMNGNSTGNEFNNVSRGSNRLKLLNNLQGGDYYIAEFSNGSESFRTTFEYTPLRLNLASATGTTAKLEWDYPNNYLMMDGDAMNIYFKKDGFDYPAVPDAKIIHGFQDINFDSVRTYTMKSLSPNVNYTAKLELVTSQGVKFVSESEFVTSKFKILDENILGLSEDGIIDKKKLELVWDINQADIEFSRGDKIDIFLKLKSHDSFSKTPSRTITEDINRVKRVEIEVPNYNESYSVKIVYTIGGVRHSSKVLDFRVQLEELKSELKDVTDSTAKIEWTYPKNFEFAGGQRIKFLLKKSRDIDYHEVKSIDHEPSKGEMYDLSKITSYTFENLQSDCVYFAKIQCKIGERIVAGSREDIIVENEFEFTTRKFTISDFSVEHLRGVKVKLKWKVSNSDYLYDSNDKVEVYVKKKYEPNYPSAVFTATGDLKNVNSAEFRVIHDVDHDIKLVYTIKGKEVVEYISYKLDLGDTKLKIDSISQNSVSISWEYPENYEIDLNDRVVILCEKEGSPSGSTANIGKKHGYEGMAFTDINNYKTQTINNLEANQRYNLRFQFFHSANNSYGYIEKRYSFKATEGIQISGINLDSINSTSMLLNWSIYNQNREFSEGDKVEIFVKEKGKSKSEDFKDIDPKISKSGNDMNDFYKYKFEDLEIGKKYVFRVQYTISKQVDNHSSSDPNDVQVVYEDIEGEPKFGNLDSYVVDTGATSVKLEVVYPEGYKTVDNDILDIFIKKKADLDYNIKPDFTAEHGKEDINLNETTVLDILGLAPNIEYNARVVFWKKGGSVKEEKEVSFKTSDVGGIGDVVVVGVMDYIVDVGIKMDPEDLLLGSDDYCKIYIKNKAEGEYPDKPNGEVLGDDFNENRVVHSYFDELNAEYTIKAVVSMGGTLYEKIIDFTSKVDDLNIEVKEINPMTAQVEWKYPDNYTLVDGESVKIYTKYKSDEDFPEDPDLELMQSDELNLSDINLIELSSLVPNTDYEVKVELNLLEADLPDVVEEFTTGNFDIENLQIRDITSEGVVISWEIDTEEVNFIDGADDFSVYVKHSDEEDYDFENPVAQFTEGLNELRTASFSVDEGVTDILVSYLVEDFETFSTVTFNSIELNVEEDAGGILVEWAYPDDIEFVDGDRVDIYIQSLDDSTGYPKEPVFRFIQGEDGDLLENTSVHLDEIDPGKYMLKLLLLTEKVSYSPVEVEFVIGESNLGYNVIRLESQGSVAGRSIVVGNGEELGIDYEQEIKVTPEGLGVESIEESPDTLKITNLVPGKLYKAILIDAINNDGEEVTFGVENVKIDAENLLQQFLTNIYKFAFERFADEGGYSYWLQKLLEKQDITGKYVVYNLMFAEKEFSERNLPDDELIKVLYQIVVNREYDEGGLQYWIKEYNETYLPQNNHDSFEAQKAIVMRMLYEQEFKNLCEKMGILW